MYCYLCVLLQYICPTVMCPHTTTTTTICIYIYMYIYIHVYTYMYIYSILLYFLRGANVGDSILILLCVSTLLYMCQHASMCHTTKCVLILLCVFILLYMCLNTTYLASSYYYICVLILLYYYMCPHSTYLASSYY
jgi:hypothetical protein